MKRLLLVGLFLMMLCGMAQAANKTVYINTDNASGTHDGTTQEHGYLTMSEMEDAEDGVSYGAGETLTVYCSGVAADAPATFAGFDTDVSITVIGDNTGRTYSTSKYRIESTSGTALTLTSGKITLQNIQIKETLNGVQHDGIDITGASCVVRNCIIVCVGTSYGYGNGIYINADNCTTSVYNNIVYGWGYSGQTGKGIYCNSGLGSTATFNIYNNTVLSCNTGIYAGNYSINNWTNNIVQDCDSAACYSGTGDGASTKAHNIANDATGTINATLTFSNKAGNDYGLAAGDTSAIGTGTDLSGTFTTDITGATRSTWDIGAVLYSTGGGSGTSLSGEVSIW